MLNALLTTIQSTFALSKSFLLGALLPVVLFALASGAVLRGEQAAFAAWTGQLVGGSATLQGVVAVAVLLAAGYVLSSVAPFLTELLEGKHVPWIAYLLPRTPWENLKRIEEKLNDCQEVLRTLERRPRPGAKPVYLIWEEHLRVSRGFGNRAGASAYAAGSPAAREIAALRGLMAASRTLPLARLQRAVVSLGRELATGNANLAAEQSRLLNRDHGLLLEAITYVRERQRSDQMALYNLRQFSFPYVKRKYGAASPVNVIAPTALGNITRTARSYTLARYGMDLDIFWTRLQRAVQKDEKFYSGLQDSKTQVDFLVALCWLSGLFSIVWGVWLALTSTSLTKFLLVGIAGPALARIFYLLACYAQRVFSDLLRSTVDLFRFDLLTMLHLPLPPGSSEEVAVWTDLRDRMGLDIDTGITYKHPP